MHIVKASLLNIVGRVVSILSTFVSIFLLGRMYGASDFGYWTWLFAIFSLVTAQDFGFISAMRVRIGQAILVDDSLEQKQLFIVALMMSLVVAIVLLGVGLTYVGSDSQKGFDVLLVLTSSLITVVGYCAAQGSAAYLQSGWIGVAESLRGVMQISVILCSKMLALDFRFTLLLFYFFSAMYTPFVIVVFLKSRDWKFAELIEILKNSPRRGTWIGVQLLKDGSYLWLMQIGLAFLTLSDVFIAGILMPDDEVAVVNAITRIVLVAVGFVMAAMTPVMGHFVAKIAELDPSLVWRRYSLAATGLALIGVIYGIFLYFFGPMVVQFWANLSVGSSYALVIAGLLFSVIGLVFLLQTFMQMAIFARAILPFLIIAGILKLTLPYFMVPIAGYGGIFLSSFMVNLTFVLIATFMLFKRGYLEKILSKA